MTIRDFFTEAHQVNKRVLLAIWLFLAIVIVFIDYVTGPFIQFPFLFVLPVVFASWYNGKWWGFAYAFVLSLVRFYFNTIWTLPWGLLEGGVNAFIRMSVLSLLAYLVDRVAQQSSAREEEVKLLEGLLPICASCKRIRNEDDEWQQLEMYITNHSEATFTHGVCPDCAQKLYGVTLPAPPHRSS